MRVAFFGSSIVSSYGNGAATWYRGILRGLHALGHEITFYEPDAPGRHEHRDVPDPSCARVVVWQGPGGLALALRHARDADVVVKASGVGVLDDRLEASVVALRSPSRRVAFWDLDASATLARVEANPADPFRALIPRFDLVFTYGGGPPVVGRYEALGATRCVPIYNGLDADRHHPVPRRADWHATLAFLGNRVPGREAGVERFFFDVARAMPDHPFLLGGEGWDRGRLPENVHWVGHVDTRDHNAFSCAPRAILTVARQGTVDLGWSPATRVFEAAGAGACIVTDGWTGIEHFFSPGEEILVAEGPEDVVRHLSTLTHLRAAAIGAAARKRALTEHTYDRRAREVASVLVARTLVEAK